MLNAFKYIYFPYLRAYIHAFFVAIATGHVVFRNSINSGRFGATQSTSRQLLFERRRVDIDSRTLR